MVPWFAYTLRSVLISQLAISLLSMKEGEFALNSSYNKHIKEYGGGVRLIQFDWHEKMRSAYTPPLREQGRQSRCNPATDQSRAAIH